MTARGVVIVGGGISGIAAARALHEAGVACTVFDRGRRIGGRLAVQTLRDTGTRWDGRPVDTGAAFITVRDPAFVEQMADWERRGLAHPWTDALAVAGPDGITGETSGVVRWSSPGGLRSLVDDLASGLPEGSVVSNRAVEVVGHDGVQPLVDGDPADLVLLCAPDPQVLRMLGAAPVFSNVRTTLGAVPWEPVLSLTAVYERRTWPHLTAMFVNGSDILSFVADDGSRRGDEGPVLVLHSAPTLARAHLDEPAAATEVMLAALNRIVGITETPLATRMHRWSLARPSSGRAEPHVLDLSAGIGVAGDAWHGGPRVEAAWLSGRSLGHAAASALGSR